MGDRDSDREPRIIVERKSSGLSTFFIGLAIGAGLALLFAPQSGAETRQRLARGARRMKKAAIDSAGEVSGQVEETFAPVDRAMHAGRAAAAQAREDLEKRLAETKAAYQAGARVARERREHDD